MQIIDIDTIEQGSKQWLKERIGSIGGSSVASAVAKGKGKTRETLLYRMAGEMLSGIPYSGYQNEHMIMGTEREPSAKALYSLMNDIEVKEVALIRSEPGKHYSPDGLVNDGLIEIKSVIPSTHIKTIDKNVVPAEYRKQIQWGLFVSKREWCDFVSYCPEISDKPMHVIRAERDKSLIGDLNAGVDSFLNDLNWVVEKIRNK
jgi:hypothetical protein